VKSRATGGKKEKRLPGVDHQEYMHQLGTVQPHRAKKKTPTDEERLFCPPSPQSLLLGKKDEARKRKEKFNIRKERTPPPLKK